jgi:hypothetical protein
MNKKSQKEIDAKTIKGKEAVGADTLGGKSPVGKGDGKPTFKGITHHGG